MSETANQTKYVMVTIEKSDPSNCDCSVFDSREDREERLREYDPDEFYIFLHEVIQELPAVAPGPYNVWWNEDEEHWEICFDDANPRDAEADVLVLGNDKGQRQATAFAFGQLPELMRIARAIASGAPITGQLRQSAQGVLRFVGESTTLP